MAVDWSFFDEVADVMRGLVPSVLGDVRHRAHRYGIKVWFDSDRPTREHYEAQVIGAELVDGARTLGLEIGFHAENSKAEDNDATVARLLGCEKRWRRALGKTPAAGPFLGRAENWRRISETWADPDLGDPDLAIETAVRLAAYVAALEPLRRQV